MHTATWDKVVTFHYESRAFILKSSVVLEYHPRWHGLWAGVGAQRGSLYLKETRLWTTTESGETTPSSEAVDRWGIIRWGLLVAAGWDQPLSKGVALRASLSYGAYEGPGGLVLSVGVAPRW